LKYRAEKSSNLMADVSEKTNYSILEMELAKQPVEIGPFSSGGNLIRF
jgi:hypothetical protein